MAKEEIIHSENTKAESDTGGNTRLERWFEQHIGNALHVFLSLLALLIFLAAILAAGDMLVRDFPKFWQPRNEYLVLQEITSTILLIAIAAELGLLLLFHRTTAAVEVIIFIIARKMVSPDITVSGLLLGTMALVGLVITRFYFLPGRLK